MISVQHLTKQFGALKAVDDISFNVAEHETLVLLGTSGCGKTTTLKMLNRLIEPTGGSISINNQNILDQSPEQLRRGIGYVLQNTGLFPHYTIQQNIAVVPQLLKWDKPRIKKRTDELLQKLHLPGDILLKYPAQLSGGQQQRVGLARALMAGAPVLLMDEPFGALDNVTRASIQQEFKTLDELKNTTIVMVTHDVQEAFELADRICLMDKGNIVQIGTPADLLFNPVNNFVREFLNAQRLQLELKAVTLRDVWPWLPATANTSADAVADQISIWEALQRRSNNMLYIVDDAGETKLAGFEQIMAAFNSYQQKSHA